MIAYANKFAELRPLFVKSLSEQEEKQYGKSVRTIKIYNRRYFWKENSMQNLREINIKSSKEFGKRVKENRQFK